MGKKKIELNDVIETTKDVGGKVEKKSKEFWSDFKKFIAKGNVVDLAVAVIIGAAFNNIVNSLVKNIITPLIEALLPTGGISELKWVLKEGVAASEGVAEVPEVAVAYGVFIQAIIDFLIIALTIFVVLRIFMRLNRAFRYKELEAAETKKKEAEAAKKAEEDAKKEKEAKEEKELVENISELKEIKDILLRMEQNK